MSSAPEQPVGELRQKVRETLNGTPMTAADIADKLGVPYKKITTLLQTMELRGECKVAGFGLRRGTAGRIPLTYVRTHRG